MSDGYGGEETALSDEVTFHPPGVALKVSLSYVGLPEKSTSLSFLNHNNRLLSGAADIQERKNAQLHHIGRQWQKQHQYLRVNGNGITGKLSR